MIFTVQQILSLGLGQYGGVFYKKIDGETNDLWFCGPKIVAESADFDFMIGLISKSKNVLK